MPPKITFVLGSQTPPLPKKKKTFAFVFGLICSVHGPNSAFWFSYLRLI